MEYFMKQYMLMLFLNQAQAVEISFDHDSTIFPKSWLTEEINAWAEPVNDGYKPVAKKIVQQELKKYPKKLIIDNFETIYVLGKIGFYDITPGGTNSNYNVYIKLRGLSDFNKGVLKKVLHHEMSSIFFWNYPEYLSKDWAKISAYDFNSGVEAIKKGQSNLNYSEMHHGDGFLNQYSRSSLENDFNEFAKFLFLGGPRLWTAAEKYPLIKKKLTMIINFYQQLDPMFDEAYFLKISQDYSA